MDEADGLHSEMSRLRSAVQPTHLQLSTLLMTTAEQLKASEYQEQWRFPLGSHTATLTITSQPGCEIAPEDIDALFEISLLFKRQVMKRHKEHVLAEYEI